MLNIKTLFVAGLLVGAAPAAIAYDSEDESDKARDNSNWTMDDDTPMTDVEEVTSISVYEAGDYNPAYLASAWLGESVYDVKGDEIGDVTDLLITADGGVEAAIVLVGGLWGIGADRVAVPIDEFQVTGFDNDEPRLSVNYTTDQFEQVAE